VAKLFAIVGPSSAYFGRKDAQQLAVVTRMADDLNLPVEVVGCPIVREPDGLALSSRNAYLSPLDREAALVLSRALRRAVDAVVGGERDAAILAELVRVTVCTEPGVALEYVEIRDAHELTQMPVLDGSALIAVAARVGETRLIDNVVVRVDDSGVTADLGIFSTSSAGTLGSTTTV
jgi:pantoate--beta-alanine ligase